ncbi:MAG TPA: (2Fe-2S)-binding protein [bacterium]|nr:(2Fe-2S)-binding protein [bacterium]HOL34951.1 (2Fe-2S)-binding protein [bacterium]HPP09106.1 (2Fe-2S)-binding protein [bacterium]HXK45372.1 (2Fe-2S)-binding protein [bacterium]
MKKIDCRIYDHPVLGKMPERKKVSIYLNNKKLIAYEGETVAAALYANGIRALRKTEKFKQPRGIFCAIGRCTDCVMTINGVPDVRTCITPVKNKMKIEFQKGLGRWKKKNW